MKEAAILIGTDDATMPELRELAITAGARIVSESIQHRTKPDPATYIGKGKIEELRLAVQADDVSVVIVDDELSPGQARNIEEAVDARVVDRTGLILDIFAARARTKEGKLQVELALLNYQLTRLSGSSVHLSRLGGGIGTRGPGETKLETDRRRIHQKIKKIRADLAGVRGSRNVQRAKRQSVPLLTLALVGYTNAGKSTLFNRLTEAGVLTDARMFATLDPTVRQIALPSRRRVLVSDTVGFIRHLPTTLVEAFRATLEEVRQAAVLLHVVDATSPQALEHCAHVRTVLAEIGADQTRQLLVLNKCDLTSDEPETRRAIAARLSGEAGGLPSVTVSALHGMGIDALLAAIDDALPEDPVRKVRFRLPHAQAGLLHELHELTQVLREDFTADGAVVETEAPESVIRRMQKWLMRDSSPAILGRGLTR